MIGGADEHVAFLLLRALELQGEVLKAYRHAVIYETLDPEVTENSFAMCFWVSSFLRRLFSFLFSYLLQNCHSEFPVQSERVGRRATQNKGKSKSSDHERTRRV